MNLTEDSFKKASKRYAEMHQVPLARAQEVFAKLLGFSNLNAALRGLGAAAATTLTSAAQHTAPAARTWLNNSFEVTLAFMRHTLDMRATHEPAVQEWSARTQRLVSAVFPDLFLSPSSSRAISVLEVRRAITLDAMSARYVRHYLSFGKDHETWPHPARGIARYLAHLPAFRLDRALREHCPIEQLPPGFKLDNGHSMFPAQDSMAHEQHAYRTTQLELALDAMEIAEQRPQVWAEISSAGNYRELRSMVDRLSGEVYASSAHSLVAMEAAA
jgi:hypothetical protein